MGGRPSRIMNSTFRNTASILALVVLLRESSLWVRVITSVI